MDEGYLDIHSHVIYGVDDGSKSLEMSLKMLEKSYEEGVRKMVATPHNYPGKDPKLAQIRERYGELREKTRERFPDFTLLLGNEILYRKAIVSDIREGRALTIGGSEYVLVEFLPREELRNIYDGLWDLVRAGYRPIVAHIERTRLPEDPRTVRELGEMGCELQVNTEIITGGLFNRMTGKILDLIGDGRIRYLGTDCHNLTDRAPRYRDAFRKLERKNLQFAIAKSEDFLYSNIG